MIASIASSALCGACGDVIPESGDQCLACGAAREREPFFYSVSLTKLAVLGATSFWLYSVWWFWSSSSTRLRGKSRKTPRNTA
jgi:hypothetical protein